MSDGNEDRFNEGYDQGYTDGRDEGYDEGFDEGYATAEGEMQDEIDRLQRELDQLIAQTKEKTDAR